MTSIRKVLVLGASGDQGFPLLQRLLEDGFQPTAGVRRVDALKDTPFASVPVVQADIEDEESLFEAFKGQDALAMHLPFEFDRARAAGFGRRIASAAKRAGLGKIVFNTSCFVAEHDLNLSAHDGRRDIERSIADSGVPYVVVRPVVFMDNLIRVWSKPSIVHKDVWAYPAGETLKISWICLEDVAAYMTCGLARDDLTAEKVLVGGPEALVGAEVAERVSVAAGRTIRFQSLTPDDYAAKMSLLVTGSSEVLPHSIYDGMAQFYRWYNVQPTSPLVVDVAAALAKLPITPTPMDRWAARQDWNRV
ncbi:NmrA family NAD(P)-binding protein [Phenylobacterium sp.]|uniref:SDR family oxidoreductase n=1 Tax=Phenylobacterium sp. TaxID=1871053 RepID=UPI00286A0FC3|nr:NmrA family NAD(P)-binding protein [Phenylobacterium sp.]